MSDESDEKVASVMDVIKKIVSNLDKNPLFDDLEVHFLLINKPKKFTYGQIYI